MAKTVDDYLRHHDPSWGHILRPLRQLLLGTELEETVKWGAPVYALDKQNVVGLGAFKSYAGVWFFDGAFLSDPTNVLVNAQEGKTRGMRQWRFDKGDEVPLDAVRSYVDEAIANARAGKGIEPKAKPRLKTPPELQTALDADASTAKAFADLTPGRRNEYCEYVADAKRADTKQRRVEKIMPMIASGVGLNDKYK